MPHSMFVLNKNLKIMLTSKLTTNELIIRKYYFCFINFVVSYACFVCFLITFSARHILIGYIH